MAKKDYFMVFDTETTITDKVADYGAVICDKYGKVYTQCSVLIKGVYGVDALFYKKGEAPSDLWSEQGKDRRFDAYEKMVDDGTRMLASVAAVNRWNEQAKGEYNPILTAYNLPFDIGKCKNTGIDLGMFSQRFCMWRAAAARWGHTKKYRQFILDTHGFNPPTNKGNMSYKTNAEIMTRFLAGNPELEDEPHTAIEDVIGYEVPILVKLLKGASKKKVLEMDAGYSWQHYQVRDHFTPK